jgi:hypothetical protein
MKLLLWILPLLFSLSAFSDQNLDVIINGKLINSTTVLEPDTEVLSVSCISNRNVLIIGTFVDNETSIKFEDDTCPEGTKFTLVHAGTGLIDIQDFEDEVLGTVEAGSKIEVYFYGDTLALMTSTSGGGEDFSEAIDLLEGRVTLLESQVGVLEQRADDFDELNVETRLLSLEAVDSANRLTALESGDYDARINSLESVNSDPRIDALEAIDSGTRLGILESYDTDDRLAVLEGLEVYTPADGDVFEVNCLSNRTILVQGDFLGVPHSIKFTDNDCPNGTTFKIWNYGNDDVSVLDEFDVPLAAISEGNHFEALYNESSIGLFQTLMRSEFLDLTDRVIALENASGGGGSEGLENYTPADGDLYEVNCLSNRTILVQGDFLGVPHSIKFTDNSCAEGTTFKILNYGVDQVAILDEFDASPAAIPEGDTFEVIYNNGAFSVFQVESLSNILATQDRLIDAENRILALENASGGGGSFDPTTSPSIIPTTDNTYKLGSYVEPYTTAADNKSWSQVVTNEVSGVKFGNNGLQPYQFSNRLNIKTRDNEYSSSGFTGSTATMWIRTGHNSGGNDYTGQMTITSGTSDTSSHPSTNVDARSAGIVIATGRAVPKGTGTATIGGMLFATGLAPLGHLDSTTLPSPPNNNQITMVGGEGLRFTATDGVVNFTKGALAISGTTTYTLTPTECPAGSCTAASPFIISSLGLTPAITNAPCTNSPTALCVAEIVISLTNSSWAANTAAKYVCIQGIGAGFIAGQRLRVRILNGSYNNGTPAQRVGSLIIGFASPKNPITGCTYNTSARFSLKYQAPTSATMPTEATMTPASQYISSHADTASAGVLYPLATGSAEFQWVSGGVGWHQI